MTNYIHPTLETKACRHKMAVWLFNHRLQIRHTSQSNVAVSAYVLGNLHGIVTGHGYFGPLSHYTLDQCDRITHYILNHYGYRI